jgi:psp operon transcriptional activator
MTSGTDDTGNGSALLSGTSDAQSQTTQGIASTAQHVGSGFRETVDRLEKQLLTAALAQQDFNRRRAAEALDLSYDQLRGLLRKHGIRGKRNTSSQ